MPKAPVRSSLSAFQEFFRTEAAGGALLFGAALAAVVVANSPWAEAYQRLWRTPIAIGVGAGGFSLTAHAWINDGLMALFFLLVGLEIKRETLGGELSTPRQAALPIAAALGGMIMPAVIYVMVAGGGPAMRGWAIAMATDIAFAIGALAMVAPRAPSGLKIFLAALAIVDDIGAVLVIALFYASGIVWHAVAMASLCLAVLVAMNLLGIRSLVPYLVIGIALWFFVHESGIHATIAGVLLALTIPVKTRLDAPQYSAEARALLDEFDRTESGDARVLTSKGQQEAIFGIDLANQLALAPLLRLERALHGFSIFGVMPLFAFSNAGVDLSPVAFDRVTLAVVLGLLFGKSLGITGGAYVAVRLRLATLPHGVGWMALHACAWIGGIGFTMALFIANLAFGGMPLLESAKVGILIASLLAGAVGTVLLRRDRVNSGNSLPSVAG